MDEWFLKLLRFFGARFGALVFVNHLHVHLDSRNLGEGSGGRVARPLLLRSTSAPPAVKPTLQIHLAPAARRERPSDLLGSGNRQHIREGWKTIIKGLDDPRKGNR
jgi:hypothetical protein